MSYSFEYVKTSALYSVLLFFKQVCMAFVQLVEVRPAFLEVNICPLSNFGLRPLIGHICFCIAFVLYMGNGSEGPKNAKLLNRQKIV